MAETGANAREIPALSERMSLTWVVVWCAIGGGWLWFFSRRLVENESRMKGAIVSDRRVQTPWGAMVIGLYMLFGACLMPINIYLHAPAFLMGVDFRGWKAALFFVAMGTLDAGIGIGLLRLARWSRIVAIYFFVFRMANTFVTFSFPASRGRFEEGVDAMQAALGQRTARRAPIWFAPVFELALMAVILWFLLTRKEAFEASGSVCTGGAKPT